MTTYGDLPASPRHGEGIACTNEDCEDFLTLYSASRGDYFLCRDSDTPTCALCESPMGLLRTRTVAEWVS